MKLGIWGISETKILSVIGFHTYFDLVHLLKTYLMVFGMVMGFHTFRTMDPTSQTKYFVELDFAVS